MSRTKQGMTSLMATVTAPPCELLPCPHYEKCKQEALACDAFRDYVYTGKKIESKGDYQVIPSRGIYNAVYRKVKED